MLSQKKMIIVQKEIEFLRMRLKDGTYYPSPHIVEELQKFLDDHLSGKQV